MASKLNQSLNIMRKTLLDILFLNNSIFYINIYRYYVSKDKKVK